MTPSRAGDVVHRRRLGPSGAAARQLGARRGAHRGVVDGGPARAAQEDGAGGGLRRVVPRRRRRQVRPESIK